jgi:23S rRNA (pseudouridine1915-N3)-methyltransferase
MLLRLIAAGKRLPQWVNDGYDDYAARLTREYRLELIEIPLGQRTQGQRTQADASKAVRAEGQRMLAAVAARSQLVALQVKGRAFTTEQLADFLRVREQAGHPLTFCIGGPDGLDSEVDSRADVRWSLSSLTLPHGLARIVVAEALYRAVSVIRGQPYHRAGTPSA